jgi:hypothetical protein
MKFRNLMILLLALTLAGVVGCSKDSTQPEAVDPVQQTASEDEFTENMEETFGSNEELPSDTDYDDVTFQRYSLLKADTYDEVLRWGRFVTGWQKTITYQLTSDTTADITMLFTQTNATFRVRGIAGVETTLTQKPFTHPITRLAKAVKRGNRWFMDEITGGFGKSDGNPDKDIEKVEIVPITNIPNSGTITIDDPQTYYFKIGAIRSIINNQVPVVNPGDSVEVTVWVSNAADDDILVMHYGVFRHSDLKFRRARRMLVRNPGRDADGPVGSKAFTQTFKAHRLPLWRIAGKFHAGIDFMTKGTIWQNDSGQPDYPYVSAAYIIPYYIIRP